MMTYSCLVIGAGNLVLKRQTFEAATDQDAMTRARDLFRDSASLPQDVRRFEVWGADRRVYIS